jgi:hypothetical protein
MSSSYHMSKTLGSYFGSGPPDNACQMPRIKTEMGRHGLDIQGGSLLLSNIGVRTLRPPSANNIRYYIGRVGG